MKNRNIKIKRKHPTKLERMPVDEKTQNLLADDLIEWALNSTSILLEKFPLSKMISPYLFFKLAKSEKNPYFSEAFDFARALCSVRMQEGNHSINMAIILRLLPVYHREYADHLASRDKHSIELAKSSAPIIVKMDTITTDIVPLRNE